MSNDAPQYNIAAIRQLLLAAFTPEDLRRFCYDRPDFRLVVRRFGPGHGHDDMADELITYCENFLLFPELLAELKQHNPRQYARFIEPELPKADQAAPDLEILTIDSPISLQLVRVPAGEFQMGSVLARDKHAHDGELPPHPVNVPAFHISKYPVTNLQYQAFVQATRHLGPADRTGERLPGDKPNHSVTEVTWMDALLFCDWLSRQTGQLCRLPTEAEWEKAARGTDGRIYPWGDDPPDKGRCNYKTGLGFFRAKTKPVGSYSPHGDSPYGLADMAGNVWKWCQSLRRPYPYQAGDGREALKGDGHRVWRGGAFDYDGWYVRCASRAASGPANWGGNIGFRLVVAPGPSDL